VPTPPVNYSARPTLSLNGQSPERLTSLLTTLAVCEQSGGLSSLELRLTNAASLNSGSAEYAYDAGGDLRFGAELIVGAGDTTAPIEIFRGLVTGIEGVFSGDRPPELVVLAEDALVKARLARRTRTFELQNLAAIVRQIAGEHGLTPQITSLDQDFGTQVQLNETDLGFLRRLLARADADLQVVGTELHVAPHSQLDRGELTLALGEDLKSARILADLAHQVTQATVKGWDASAGNALSAEGTENALGPGSGDRGSELLGPALGDRPFHAGGWLTFNQDETDTLAATLRNHRARRFLRAQGVATGNPRLRVGTRLHLQGLGDWFSNAFRVVQARHIYDQRAGYQTEFTAECAYLGRAS
jgi:phage protein D